MSRRKKNTPKDPLQSVQVATAKARLAKLKAELPPPATAEYTRYEDLRPLHPDDRARLKQKFIDLLTVNEEKLKKEKHDWYMSMAHWAP